MTFLCYKCHKIIRESFQFHNSYCKRPFRNMENYNNYNNNYLTNRNRNYSNNKSNRNRNFSLNKPTFYDQRNNNRNRYNNYRNHYNINHYHNNDRNHRNQIRINYRNTNRNNNEQNSRERNNNLGSRIDGALSLMLSQIDDLDNIMHSFGEFIGFNNDDDINSNLFGELFHFHDSGLEGNEDDDSINSKGLSEEKINSFPKNKFEDLNKIKEIKCIICLEEYKEGDEITTIPCFHMFHYNCISNWLKNHDMCPICKTNLNEDS